MFTEIGFIRKTNGFKGEVILAIHGGSAAEFAESRFLFLDMDGSTVPFFVEHFSDETGNIVVKFEDVNSHESAVALVSRKVFLPAEEHQKLFSDVDEIKSFTGYKIIDKEIGAIGTVKEVSEMPGQIIISFAYGGAEVLMPVHEKTLLKILRKKKELHVKLPDGLLDVYIKRKRE